MMTDLFHETTSVHGVDGKPPAGLPWILELASPGVAIATVLAAVLAICSPPAHRAEAGPGQRPTVAATAG